MKLANMVFAFVIFSIVVTMMFATTYDVLLLNKGENASDFQELSGDYNEFAQDIGGEGSTTRNILDQSEEGEATSEDRDVNLVSGGISGGRLTINFFANFNKVIDQVSSDSGIYIDNRIIGAIIVLITVFLVLVGLHFLRGFKTET